VDTTQKNPLGVGVLLYRLLVVLKVD